jgi:hypothetical protein
MDEAIELAKLAERKVEALRNARRARPPAHPLVEAERETEARIALMDSMEATSGERPTYVAAARHLNRVA